MAKIRFAALALLIMVAAPLVTLAQQTTAAVAGTLPDGKVVVVNTNLFPSQIGELKQKYDQVENQFKDRTQRIDQLRQQVTTKESELQSKGSGLSADRLRDLQLEIEDIKKRGTREVEDLQRDFAKALEGTTKPVRDKLYTFMQNYAAQRGIVLIIDLPSVAQTGTVAYFAPSADVTQDFITEYNKANPVPGGASPPPAAQPATRPAARPGAPKQN